MGLFRLFRSGATGKKLLANNQEWINLEKEEKNGLIFT